MESVPADPAASMEHVAPPAHAPSGTTRRDESRGGTGGLGAAPEEGTRRRPSDETWARAQAAVLRRLATGASLAEVLEALCRAIEAVTPGARASVLLVADDGRTLRPAAGPSLPADFVRETEGLPITGGPDTGACGRAAFLGGPVESVDLATDPLATGMRHLPTRFGLRACCSHPILSVASDAPRRAAADLSRTDASRPSAPPTASAERSGVRRDASGAERAHPGVLGTFAVYADVTGAVDDVVRVRLAEAADLASVAITRARATDALEASLAAHAASEARLAAVLAALPEAVVESDATGRWTYLSPAWEAINGRSVASRLGQPLLDDVAPEDRPIAAAVFRAFAAGERTGVTAALRFVRPDGTMRWCEVRGRACHDADGRFTGALGIIADITERRRAEDALAASEARFRAAFDQSNIGQALNDAGGHFVRVNQRLCELLGYDADALIGRTLHSITHADDLGTNVAVRDALLRGERATYRLEKRYLHRDGHVVWVDLSAAVAATDASGRPTLVVSQMQEITARKIAEAALVDSQARLEFALAAARMGTWHWDASTGVTTWSRHVALLLGLAADAPAPTTEELAARMEPDERVRRTAVIAAAIAHGEDFEVEFRIRGEDGAVRWWVERGRVQRDAHGRAVHMDGVVLDQTGRKQAEAALAERTAQLQHAQRLEAIGRLAGGVAHDFNNLLTVIRGNAEFVAETLPDDHLATSDVVEIRRAADRAAALTRQLLAFGRRQVLHPTPLDLGDVVRGLEPMLKRLLGVDVALVVAPRERPVMVMADAGQVEQIVVNLAVNARDAMPTGGMLVLDVREVRLDAEAARAITESLGAGRYAVLDVTDTGHGMPPEVLARVFEPFFTTKPIGEGTGLGLATVYGIATQSGGGVAIESGEGRGTRVCVYLPWYEAIGSDRESPDPMHPRPPAERSMSAVPRAVDVATANSGGSGPAGGTALHEPTLHGPTRASPLADAAAPVPRMPPPAAVARATVLVVEDEAAVRAMARRSLERAGYVVHEAPHGADALLLLRALADGRRTDGWKNADHQRTSPAAVAASARGEQTLHDSLPALVLTDLNMPEMGGEALATRLAAEFPSIRVLFMSGYPGDPRGGETTGGDVTRAPRAVPRLVKPFTTADLVNAVADALASPPTPRVR